MLADQPQFATVPAPALYLGSIRGVMVVRRLPLSLTVLLK